MIRITLELLDTNTDFFPMIFSLAPAFRDYMVFVNVYLSSYLPVLLRRIIAKKVYSHVGTFGRKMAQRWVSLLSRDSSQFTPTTR